MTDLEKNLRAVQERIARAAERAHRDPGEITLVAISKTFPVEAVLAVRALGVQDVGENRVEEAGDKIPQVNERLESGQRITWHMVGHLQHRKVKDASTLFDIVHSVDSLRLARRLSDRARETGHAMPVLLEVNVSGETSKYGLAPNPREEFLATVGEMLALPNLDVQGLMTMAPIVSSPEDARPYFRALRALRDELRARYPDQSWRHLSMGMTDDFQVAISEGATMVRIGRAIFGARSCSVQPT